MSLLNRSRLVLERALNPVLALLSFVGSSFRGLTMNFRGGHLRVRLIAAVTSPQSPQNIWSRRDGGCGRVADAWFFEFCGAEW